MISRGAPEARVTPPPTPPLQARVRSAERDHDAATTRAFLRFLRRMAVLHAMLLAGAAATARAAEPGAPPSAPATLEVSLDIQGCPSLPNESVRRLAALELDTHIVEPARAGPRATRVQVSCAGTNIDLGVADPLTGKQLSRTISRSSTDGEVAARLVALAVSELVVTSWLELTLSGPERAMNGTDAQAGELALRRAARDRAERRATGHIATGYVLVVGQATGPFTGVGLGWGGGLRLGWTSGRPWLERERATASPALDLDLTGTRGEVNEPLGNVRVSVWSAAPRASMRLQRGRGWLDAGLGGRFGLARLDGTPLDSTQTRGGSLAGTWAGPIATLGAGVRLWHLVFAAGLEAGYVVRKVTAFVDTTTSLSIAGPWLTGSLAIGWGV